MLVEHLNLTGIQSAKALAHAREYQGWSSNKLKSN